MASGDTLLVILPISASFPATASPGFGRRNNHMVLEFDDTTDEICYFEAIMPRTYDGGGVTVYLVWMAKTATTNGCQWEVAFERHEVDAFDLDADGFAAVQSGADTTASASGEVIYTAVTFTDGAQMDSVAAGESFRLQVNRDTGYGSDLTGDVELLKIEIKET